MSEHEDLSAFDEPAEPDSTEPESWAEEPADDGWSPVTGSPPPDAEPDADAVDVVPPHEQPDDGLAPPGAPPDPDAELGAPPPPPAEGDLPPALPDDAIADPVDLSGGAALDDAPMPPVTGDTDAGAPPAAGEIDLGDDGPPLAPDAPAGADEQSPVPAMGDQSPVPVMGNPSPTPTTGEVDLGDDGAPMPPGLEGADTTTAPPGAEPDIEIELPGDPGAAQTIDPTADEDPTTVVATEEPPAIEEPPYDGALLSVEQGQERVSAAAMTGAYLDQMGLDDPARERMITIVEDYATDGTITMDELDSAFKQAGFGETSTDGSEQTLTVVLEHRSDLPTSALVEIDGEGIGVYRISEHGGVVELESLQTGAVYAAEPRAVAQAWRESGSRVIIAPTPAPAPGDVAPVDLAAATEEADAGADDGSDGGLRNVFVAGAVLLPLAGGAAYLATRKIR